MFKGALAALKQCVPRSYYIIYNMSAAQTA